MEDKDPKDDELNPEGQDDINDADDSFGLPDLDYKPLEDVEEPVEEEIIIEEEVTETVYFSDQDESEESDESTDDSQYDEMEEKEEPVRKYSSYRDEESNSNTSMIIIGVVAVLIIALGVWYFVFYESAETEREKMELAEAQRLETIRLQEEAAATRIAEAEATEAAEEIVEEEVAESEATSERGAITTISEPTGRYYVVIGSFIDVDLATDLGKELAAKGVGTKLISPFSKKRLFRLCVADFGTFADATAGANNLKAEYGENLWVLKY